MLVETGVKKKCNQMDIVISFVHCPPALAYELPLEMFSSIDSESRRFILAVLATTPTKLLLVVLNSL